MISRDCSVDLLVNKPDKFISQYRVLYLSLPTCSPHVLAYLFFLDMQRHAIPRIQRIKEQQNTHVDEQPIVRPCCGHMMHDRTEQQDAMRQEEIQQRSEHPVGRHAIALFVDA